MECNKDEASRAKEIAEKKFTAKDIAGAKKFALKAQNLYPGLDGLPQMLATLDVYISAENKINGEADWYGILGVNPHADDDTVRKQYRKLALMLHPDKNKSLGADGAFKLISEAWSLLSDKAKRIAYDQKRKVKGFQQKGPAPSWGSPVPPGANGVYNFTKNTSSSVKTQKSTSRVAPSSAPPPPTTSTAKAQKNTSRVAPSSIPPPLQKSKPNTFWTVCHRCKMQYEYLRVYLNHNLLCPNCHEPFFAVETAPPTTNGSKSSTTWNFSQQQQNSNHQTANKNTINTGRNNAAPSNVGQGGFNGTDSFNQSNFQWGPFSRATGASTTAQAATVVQQAYEKVKREREEAQAATKREEALKRKNNVSRKMGGVSSSGVPNAVKKRKGMDDACIGNYGRVTSMQTGMETSGAGISSVSGSRQANFEMARVNGINKSNGMRDISQLEIQNMLMTKARAEIRKKLNEWNSGTVAKPAIKEKIRNDKKNEKERENPPVNRDTHGHNKSCELLTNKNGVCTKPFSGNSGVISDAEMIESMSINVPDPDFHDFDKDRTEKAFEENQVWAAYDDDDGMPRYYALIHNVISLNPFKMRISWLNSKTNSELGPLNWVGSGFSKTCGDFRVGRYEFNSSLNSFSHKVRWSKGARGAICIYPRKGDVWALYRNWSPDWNELTANEVIHKYDMVEVLEDYNEELGVTVTPLVKVAGFKTVFHQHLDPREVKRIPREEMFRFSHHVPSYLLTGQEAANAPKGCRELDTAATPLELLQIITDVKEEEVVQNEEENGVNADKTNEEKILGNSEKEKKDVISVSSKDTCEAEILDDRLDTAEAEKLDCAKAKTNS
ncbi:uncharacterized protein LOC131144765 [Malania oleifera]|uniref:uncharacterized protein LOC131144765 n=1 Tax=Malania oleifera TaxID=397392 RepID=UPI0025AE9043|nr:uncharacterized protein LOC131144765 [Malania oleifera]XP_057949601.1 uncharacterized protein LOC131144765 [Malania oleifera]